MQRAATLELVLDELSRMNRIVRDLQALTKASQPGFVHPEPVELGGLLDELLVKAGALEISTGELAHRDRGIVVVDRQRVTQAMLQLAASAARHSPHDGSIHIGDASWVTPWAVRRRQRPRHSPAGSRRGDPALQPGIDSGSRCRRRRAQTALVTAIAQAHHGHLDIGDSELGGAGCAWFFTHAVNHTFAGTRS